MLSQLFGGRPVRVFNSGTAALEIALRIAGIGPGDEVITTPLSWVATSNVILAVGARPVFVDIDPFTRNLDPDRIETAITPATRAIMPVDLAGLPVNRDRLYDIAGKHGLRVIEDAAQAFGSSWRRPPDRVLRRPRSRSVFIRTRTSRSIEGGCLVLNDDGRSGSRGAVPSAGRHPHRHGRHGRRSRRREVQPHRRRRPRRDRATAPSRGVHREPPRTGLALLRRAGHAGVQIAGPAASLAGLRRRATGTCSR